MSPIRSLVLSSALLFTLPVHSETAMSADQQLQLMRVAGEADRQATLTANVAFTSEEAENFWPIYREYRAEVATLMDRLVTLIKTFAAQYPNVSDGQANALVKDYLAIEADRTKLRQRFVKRFGKVLPPTKLARALQIEHKLDTLADFDISRQIPLVPAK